MNLFLKLAFLFFIGSVIGWIMELLFRRFISSSNPERKWINPGFCTGPYLPLYGCGLCILYLIGSLDKYNIIESPILNKIALLMVMAISMTLIEYIAGIISWKFGNVRLWDYTKEWGNIQGIICPKFSLIWGLLGGFYYFFINPYILGALTWLSENLAFSFVIGQFFGIFWIDVAHSTHLMVKLKAFAKENDIIIRYETLKAEIHKKQIHAKQKYHFFSPFHTTPPLFEHLHELTEAFEKKTIRTKKR